MVRLIGISVVLLGTFSLGLNPALSRPTAENAKVHFQQLQLRWQSLVKQLQEKHREKQASPSQGRENLDKEIKQLNQESELIVQEITEAGLEAIRGGLKDDPTINNTLMAIAGFYVTGDPNGDGGDQYERALPLIRSLLDAGLAETNPDLWLWGGVSAYTTNDYPLARKYFEKASQAGLIGSSPPSRDPGDPRARVWMLASSCVEKLNVTQGKWEQEKQIRAAEAKADDLPRVKLQTSQGDIIVELFENEAPIAAANFVALVRQGYYNGLTFHRVLPGFMAQGGCNLGDGTGGPGYKIRDEHTLPNHRKHFRGSLSMAKTAAPNTAGSQFFLTFVPTTYLDGKHTVFGRVVEGMDVAAALKRRDPNAPGPKPVPDKIIQAQVMRDRGHEYQFEKLPSRR